MLWHEDAADANAVAAIRENGAAFGAGCWRRSAMMISAGDGADARQQRSDEPRLRCNLAPHDADAEPARNQPRPDLGRVRAGALGDLAGGILSDTHVFCTFYNTSAQNVWRAPVRRRSTRVRGARPSP